MQALRNKALLKSISSRFKEQSMKLLYRWHFTPLRLSCNISQDVTSSCCRRCGNIGIYFHIWTCPPNPVILFQRFYRIEPTTGQTFERSPNLALPSLFSGNNEQPFRKQTITFSCMAACLEMATNWKGIYLYQHGERECGILPWGGGNQHTSSN